MLLTGVRSVSVSVVCVLGEEERVCVKYDLFLFLCVLLSAFARVKCEA